MGGAARGAWCHLHGGHHCGVKGRGSGLAAPRDSQRPATEYTPTSTLPSRGTQRGGRVCQFFLGLVQKTQTKKWLESSSPHPSLQRSQISLPHPFPTQPSPQCNGAMVRMLVRIGAKQGAGPGWLGVEGVWGWQARQEWGGPRGLPGRGSRPPGGLSWGRQGSGGGGRQCRPRGRCGPWRLPGTSACRSQSAVTQEEGRERVTGETRGGTQDGRRDQNVIIRCLSPGSGCPRSEPPFGHHPLPGWCGH